MKKLFAIALVSFIACLSPAQQEIARDKRAEIDKMLRLTGMEKMMGQMMGQLMTTMQKQMPDVPPEFWARFQAKVDTHELVEKIIPLYDKYYTLEDLKAVNAFYESPAGQKILSTMPQITQESAKVGQEWGQKIARQAAQEAQQEIDKNKKK
jgi:uncharacterized protein